MNAQKEAEYRGREMYRHRAEVRSLDSLSTQDKHDAMNEFRDDYLLHPERLRFSVEMILAGNYGIAPQDDARRAIGSPTRNVAAALSQLVAALDCRCPNDRARRAYTMLSPEEQEEANKAIMGEVADYLAQQVEDFDEIAPGEYKTHGGDPVTIYGRTKCGHFYWSLSCHYWPNGECKGYEGNIFRALNLVGAS